ncbi:hypothetical protein N752_04125 [Desulforamulus aquiferis]|nr:hypothetical protein N752_04125 [Desulforamulus aquiferis]
MFMGGKGTRRGGKGTFPWGGKGTFGVQGDVSLATSVKNKKIFMKC